MKYYYTILLFVCLFNCSKEKPVLHTIHFDHGTTDIIATDSILLYENLTFLQDNINMNITLEGYTNTVGSDTANMTLSIARVETLKTWFVDKDVDIKRITTIGYGESNPVGDNRTVEGRALNDRVEFVLTD